MPETLAPLVWDHQAEESCEGHARKPLEEASEQLVMDLRFGFEVVALPKGSGNDEEGFPGMMVGCREGEQVDLRDQSSAQRNYESGW